MNEPTCKVCDNGKLGKKRVYRMSGIVVFIGYILCIPSIFGMLFGVLFLYASSKQNSVDFINERMRHDLMGANIPSQIIENAMTGNPIKESDIAKLSDKQKNTLDLAVNTRNSREIGAKAGKGIAAAGSIFIMVFSLVGGLLGYLLIMKKTVLKCSNCGATVNAL